MWISDLSQETLEELCSALGRGPTLDWKALMRKWFSTYPRAYYSEVDVEMIEREFQPAKALLDDLTRREIPLEELVNGLSAIRNNKAVSIIRKGAWKNGLYRECSGGRPPPYFSTGQTQEKHQDFTFSGSTQPSQPSEQDETLKVPLQESVARDPPYDPEQEKPLNWGEAMMSTIFSCFFKSYSTFYVYRTDSLCLIYTKQT